MNSDEAQNVIVYNIFKVFNDETRTYIGTTHVPNIALQFCEQHEDCIIERNISNVNLMDLESRYQYIMTVVEK